MRSLFCFANGISSGANFVLAQFVRRLRKAGQEVDIFVWGQSRHAGWGGSDLGETPGPLEVVLARGYDFVFCSNLFLLPLIFPHLTGAQPVLVYQGHESYCYGKTYEEVIAEVPLLLELLQLPVHIIATSNSIQQTLRDRANSDSWLVPIGIDKENFYERRTVDFNCSPKRILMVGSYLFALKGITDGLEALRILHNDFDLKAVLITAEKRGRGLLSRYPFDIEIHCRVDQATMGSLYGSSHLYLCTSWYEGLGLPTLEAFACGTPVVCTSHSGVTNYGVDRHNLLLAKPHNPEDIAQKICELLMDAQLASQLAKNSLETAGRFTYDETLPSLLEFQQHASNHKLPAVSADEMPKLAAQLESQGLFTPLETQKAFLRLSGELDNVCSDVVNSQISSGDALREITRIKEQAAGFLHLPNSEYYSSFKSRFDLCRLLSAVTDGSELKECAQSVLKVTSQ